MTTAASTIAVVFVAAGKGLRFGGSEPKQYRQVGKLTLLGHTLSAWLSRADITQFVVVIGASEIPAYQATIAGLAPAQRARLSQPVTGGETRQASVRAGLEALTQIPPDLVLIHDAARPFATADLIDRAIAAAKRFGAAIPGVAPHDTIKRVSPDGLVEDTLDRSHLRAIQTPQVFDFRLILDAHRKAHREGHAGFTDDAAVAEWAGHAVHVFDGEAGNLKITTPADIAGFKTAPVAMTPFETRSGLGYDVHAFDAGDHVMLGGVRIAHDAGVVAHSDGDVVLHALTDALLGAIGDGDIGTHFPPSDSRWRGASSDRFLADAAGRVASRGGRIINLDVTVVCEAPRIGPHREAMRERIAAIAGVTVERVSIKATTSEEMGFTGRREGLAAQAIVSIELPREEDVAHGAAP